MSSSVQGGPRGSGEALSSNGGLRALEEAWITTFCLRHFPVKSGRFLCVWGVSWWLQEASAASKEVPGGQGKPRAPERWPESFGRGLDNDLIEGFSCQVSLFSGLLGVRAGWRLRAEGCRLEAEVGG